MLSTENMIVEYLGGNFRRRLVARLHLIIAKHFNSVSSLEGPVFSQTFIKAKCIAR